MSGALRPEAVASCFTRSDGSYHFARWGRPLAPVVFGTDDATLGILKDAIREVAALGGLPLTETDPELGANLLIFFIEDWQDLAEVPNLGRLVPDLPVLLDRLGRAGANQYRSFRFDELGAIKLCIILLRLDSDLASVPAQTIGTAQMVQSMLLWSDTAFHDESPIARMTDGAHAVARPAVAALIRAAYDPVLPPMSLDPSHALRLAARAELLIGGLGDDA